MFCRDSYVSACLYIFDSRPVELIWGPLSSNIFIFLVEGCQNLVFFGVFKKEHFLAKCSETPIFIGFFEDKKRILKKNTFLKVNLGTKLELIWGPT